MSKRKKNKCKEKKRKPVNNFTSQQPKSPNIALINRLKHLLKNRNLVGTIDHILKHYKSMRTTDEEISKFIYEYYIKPDELSFLERFNKNISLLKNHEILFPELNPDFEDIKHKTFSFHGWSLLREKEEIIINRSPEESSRLLVVDVVNLDMIERYIEGRDYLYLTYDDLRNFYYLLLFEDLYRLKKVIEEGKIVFLVIEDKDILLKFFSNLMVYLPSDGIDKSRDKSYGNRINGIVTQIRSKKISYIKRLNDYYKDLDHNYYKDLFYKDPSNIKILLPTPQRTTVNKYITRNWYNAFIDLGYNAEFLIDKKPYEHMTDSCVLEKMYEFKPDICFFINCTVNSIIGYKNDDIIKNLLWIMRYRDDTVINYAEPGNNYNNMFILVVFKKYVKELKSIGIPENRMLYTADGPDLNLFTKKNTANGRYSCDVVSVNNQVGNESITINVILKNFQGDLQKRAILELCANIKEIAFNGEVLLLNNPKLEKLINEKFTHYGLQINEKYLRFLSLHLSIVSHASYRGKLVEWIIDSKITKNIKIWGSGWSNIEKFRRFHMGLAKYEEIPYIYGNSKISLSDSDLPLHERNFEILASGGFPLVKYLPPENDEYRITDYFKEDEDIVLYYNKDDLLNKIQYYLDNPDERERLANNGRNIVYKHFTNTAIVKKTMEFIKSYYLKS